MIHDLQYIITPHVVTTKEDGTSNLVFVLKEMRIQDGYHHFVTLLFATADEPSCVKYEQLELERIESTSMFVQGVIFGRKAQSLPGHQDDSVY